MGLFDSLLNGAKEVLDGTQRAFDKMQADAGQAEDGRFDHPSEPRPAVAVHTRLLGKDVSFMISGDFTEHEGYTNSAVSFKYNPDHLGVLEADDENEITVSLMEGVGDFDEIADIIDEFLTDGGSDAEEFEIFTDGPFMFRGKVSGSGEECFYVLRSNVSDAYDYGVLLLVYPSEIKDTVLEKKLTDCFDEAARTLVVQTI